VKNFGLEKLLPLFVPKELRVSNIFKNKVDKMCVIEGRRNVNKILLSPDRNKYGCVGMKATSFSRV
jgi:hypothetical protein